MSLLEIDRVYGDLRHAGHKEARVVVLDNNPFNGFTADEVHAALADRPWLAVIDHHGVFNDGRKHATFARLAEALPSLFEAGFLKFPTAVVTDRGNVDPDGLLSFFLAVSPEKSLEHRQLLEAVSVFTDFTMFGGELIDESYTTHDPVKRFSYALLQLITEEKEAFAERALDVPVEQAAEERLRELFDLRTDAGLPRFDDRAVEQLYERIVRLHLPEMLNRPEPDAPPAALVMPRYVKLADEFEGRLRYVAARARDVSRVWGSDDAHPGGKLAYLLPETGFLQRLDKGADGYPVYDWLAEAVAGYATEAPVQLQIRDGFCVLSVRHPREGESRIYEYDVSGMAAVLNGCLRDRFGIDRPAFYGRKEVVLGRIPEDTLTSWEVLEIVKERWETIARAGRE